MTFEEAKDQIAELHGLDNWAQVINIYGYVGKWAEEAAELYCLEERRRTWDEAIEQHQANIISKLKQADISILMPAKPEFKP